MRLLLVNHFPLQGSGSGVYTQNIASRMWNRKHVVKVIVVDNKNPGVSDYPYPVRTIYYPQFPCFTTHPHSNNTFYDLAREEMNHYLKTFQKVIYEEARSFKPDLIHCQHLWIAPYVVSSQGLPYIITAHGTDIKGFKKDMRYRNAALLGAERAEMVITISHSVHEQVKKYYNLKEEKLKLIWNGFDENIFKNQEIDSDKLWAKLFPGKKGDIGEKRVISFVGKLTHFKGVDLLLEAGSHYEKILDDVVTLITGDGNLSNELKQKRKELGLKNFYFLGNQPQDIVAKINNIAEVAVVPSRDEPFGLVALEALACGTPVVASNTGGLTDFITEDVGRLFNEGNSKELAEKIIVSLQENDKLTKGGKASKYAKENFSWERVVDDLEGVYETVLKGESK